MNDAVESRMACFPLCVLLLLTLELKMRLFFSSTLVARDSRCQLCEMLNWFKSLKNSQISKAIKPTRNCEFVTTCQRLSTVLLPLQCRVEFRLGFGWLGDERQELE